MAEVGSARKQSGSRAGRKREGHKNYLIHIKTEAVSLTHICRREGKMVDKRFQAPLLIIAILIVALLVYGGLTMKDTRTVGEKVGDALNELQDRTPGQKLGDTVKGVGDKIKDNTQPSQP
jgi:hypothetical protein